MSYDGYELIAEQRGRLLEAYRIYKILLKKGTSSKEAMQITFLSEKEIHNAEEIIAEREKEKNPGDDIPIHQEVTEVPHEEYYHRRPDGGMLQYESDILDGRIHISEVHYKYRDDTAYILAMRRVRELYYGKPESYVELRIIENLMLEDIAEARRRGDKEKIGWLNNLYLELRDVLWWCLDTLCKTGYGKAILGPQARLLLGER